MFVAATSAPQQSLCTLITGAATGSPCLASCKCSCLQATFICFSVIKVEIKRQAPGTRGGSCFSWPVYGPVLGRVGESEGARASCKCQLLSVQTALGSNWSPSKECIILIHSSSEGGGIAHQTWLANTPPPPPHPPEKKTKGSRRRTPSSGLNARPGSR